MGLHLTLEHGSRTRHAQSGRPPTTAEAYSTGGDGRSGDGCVASRINVGILGKAGDCMGSASVDRLTDDDDLELMMHLPQYARQASSGRRCPSGLKIPASGLGKGRSCFRSVLALACCLPTLRQRVFLVCEG
mmetsp:Transcript_45929/g.133064  ORF Transcript_45929/g.133064 Transcript_45929/m.133064 type:complete len:132 (+) Transcript_45929:885-1280(+)